ncbi:MAG: class I SAM-dependent methyltransferase [Actinomycetota bacterium]|nr:class I SAM-dependent methyltransferase [Actinomycetota bacterium]
MFRNTYLMAPKWLFSLVVRQRDFDRILASRATDPPSPPRPIWRRMGRAVMPWFWPRIWEAQRWVQAGEATWWKPSGYQIDEPGPLMVRLLQETPSTNSVIDLGCNSGSNLKFLHRAGFRRLYGVEAGFEALELFARTYQEAWACAEVRHDLFQHYLAVTADRAFDTVHFNGVSIELVHPSYPMVSEICRVTADSVFISLTEHGHTYPRHYIRQFESHGFRLVWCERPVDLVNESSILHFVRING